MIFSILINDHAESDLADSSPVFIFDMLGKIGMTGSGGGTKSGIGVFYVAGIQQKSGSLDRVVDGRIANIVVVQADAVSVVREPIREIVHIVEFGHCQLADIGNTVDSMRFVARFVQSRQQNSGKNCNNRNGYQEFYKRKIQMPPEAESSCFHSQNSLIDVGETDIWEPSPDF